MHAEYKEQAYKLRSFIFLTESVVSRLAGQAGPRSSEKVEESFLEARNEMGVAHFDHAAQSGRKAVIDEKEGTKVCRAC